MEPDKREPFDLDEVPDWVKKATNVTAFIFVAILCFFVVLFLFFFVVKAGLWAVGVL